MARTEVPCSNERRHLIIIFSPRDRVVVAGHVNGFSFVGREGGRGRLGGIVDVDQV